jgi:cellulose biosynthesis protein BcsQ
MKAIGFHVEKGGVGKTTVSGTVAAELRNYGRVLVADGDPQGNLTGWMWPEAVAADLADAVQGKADLSDAIVSVRDGLDLLPTIAIDGELKTWGETVLPGKPFAFADLRDAIEAQGYDFLVWDLGPGISALEKSILATVDEVIGVVLPESFSVDGLETFESELEKLRRDRRAAFTCDRLVVNRVNRSYSLHTAYLEQFETLPYRLYVVGQSTGVSDAVPRHQTVFEYSPGDRTIPVFRQLAEEIAYVSTTA